MKRADLAETARQLRAVLDAIERGELLAEPGDRARLEGAATALELLSEGPPPSS